MTTMFKWKGYTKGVNLGGWISQCPYNKTHHESFIQEEDIQQIASWGLDHVRLPIDYEVLQTEDGTYLEEGFGYIDKCMHWCQKYDLNVILDLHKTAGYAFYNLETNALFTDTNLQNRFIQLWETLASRYAYLGNHVAFELLNEIVEENSLRWNKLAQKAILAIRQIAPTTKIIIGGIQWNSVHTLDQLDPPFDENIIYTFHFYEPFLFTHQRASWVDRMPQEEEMTYPSTLSHYRETASRLQCFGSGLDYEISEMGAEYMESLMEKAITIAKERGVQLYCGEYGVIDHAPLSSTVNWFRDIHEVFEKYEIGRAAWTYKKMNFGLADAHYKEGIEEIITYL